MSTAETAAEAIAEDTAQKLDARAPLRAHIGELRTRLVRAVAALFIGVIAAWFFRETLFDWLMQPYTKAMTERFPEDATQYIEYRSLTEPLVIYLKTSFIGGLLAAMPIILYQIWKFVVPGLYKEERSLATSFLLATVVLFIGGVLFCRYMVLDYVVGFLLNFGATNTTPAIMMSEYFDFTSRILLVFGLLFEMPVVISFLAFLGLVTHTWLFKQWRYAVVAIFIVGAVLTPPDPVTQTLLAIPLIILYFISIGIAWFFDKRRERKAARASGELKDDERGTTDLFAEQSETREAAPLEPKDP